MLDLKYLRENSEEAINRLKTKGDRGDITAILEYDGERRKILQKVEQLKHERNQHSQEVSIRKKNKEDASELIEKTRNIGKEIKTLDETLKTVQQSLSDALDKLPNLPHSSVPIGKSEAENVVVRACGKIPEFDFEISDHMEISDRLDLLDFPRGSKITGRGFPIYKGAGAKLERALINFMLDLHTEKHNYQEVSTPYVVNRASMRGTGQLPKMEDDMYHAAEDDLFLIPTAEVPVTNIYRDELLAMKDLPIRHCAYSPCFRREAGSWGKDTRGLLRLHQFNKVEMVKIVDPETSYAELDSLLQDACDVLEKLALPYRILELCTGDLSFAAAKCYDIEVWSPAEKKWLEVSSCSNFEDFQARRMHTRFRKEPKAKPEFVHTLNGSGLATPRLMVALLEVYQQDDGSVKIPEALQKYTRFNFLKRDN